MREQKREFELMVEAQKAQVRALEAQAFIFEDEKRRRDEDITRQYISRLARSIVSTIKYSNNLAVAWRPIRSPSQNYEEFLDYWALLQLGGPPDDVEDAFLFYSRQVVKSSADLFEIAKEVSVRISNTHGGAEDRHAVFMTELQRLIHLSGEAISARNSASSIEQELLAHLKIEEFHNALSTVKAIFDERFK
jgi:hypothetical protein